MYLFQPANVALPIRPLLVRTLTSLEHMERVADEWQRFEQASTAPIAWFQTYQWCSTWMRVHGKNDYSPHIYLLYEGNELVAVWPLMLERSTAGIKVLRSLGEPHSQYANILTRDGKLSEAQALILRSALQASRADSIVLNLVPEGSPLKMVMPSEHETAELTNEAAYLDLTQYKKASDFIESASKSVKKNRRRGMGILGREGEVRLEVVQPGTPKYEEHIKTCLDLKAAWIGRTGRISFGLAFPDHARFLSCLRLAEGSDDGPKMFVLFAGKKPVAYEIGFLHRGHYYCYLGSFVWRYRDASPGKIQMEKTIEWLIENGAASYDLLANPADYKKNFSSATVPLTGYAWSLTLAGKAHSAIWTKTIRPIVKRLHGKLPADLRRGLNIVSKLELSNSV
jgi:CelD/BcsL family acetyltransferase involved in cellulose biosynthesis